MAEAGKFSRSRARVVQRNIGSRQAATAGMCSKVTARCCAWVCALAANPHGASMCRSVISRLAARSCVKRSRTSVRCSAVTTAGRCRRSPNRSAQSVSNHAFRTWRRGPYSQEGGWKAPFRCNSSTWRLPRERAPSPRACAHMPSPLPDERAAAKRRGRRTSPTAPGSPSAGAYRRRMACAWTARSGTAPIPCRA